MTVRSFRRGSPGRSRVYSRPYPEAMVADAALIADALDRTLAVVRPQRVVLFGSYARGDAGPDSDLDLLVVTPFEGPRSQTALAVLMALVDLPVPTDAVVLQPEEWERWRNVPGTIAYPADREGVVLYEA